MVTTSCSIIDVILQLIAQKSTVRVSHYAKRVRRPRYIITTKVTVPSPPVLSGKIVGLCPTPHGEGTRLFPDPSRLFFQKKIIAGDQEDHPPDGCGSAREQPLCAPALSTDPDTTTPNLAQEPKSTGTPLLENDLPPYVNCLQQRRFCLPTTVRQRKNRVPRSRRSTSCTELRKSEVVTDQTRHLKRHTIV